MLRSLVKSPLRPNFPLPDPLLCLPTFAPEAASPFLATHPKNAPLSPIIATLTKTNHFNSFACHTYEKMPGGPLPSSHPSQHRLANFGRRLPRFASRSLPASSRGSNLFSFCATRGKRGSGSGTISTAGCLWGFPSLLECADKNFKFGLPRAARGILPNLWRNPHGYCYHCH